VSTLARKHPKHAGQQYFVMPHPLVRSPAWRDLSVIARALFVELATRHNGVNNGDLSVSFPEAKAAGVCRGRDAFFAAFDELWAHGFITLTRPGGPWPVRTPNLWAITLWPVPKNASKAIYERPRTDDWKRWTPTAPAPDFEKKYPGVVKRRERRKEMIAARRRKKLESGSRTRMAVV
jgi:hypothetical protein